MRRGEGGAHAESWVGGWERWGETWMGDRDCAARGMMSGEKRRQGVFEKWTAFEIDTFSERGVQAGKGIDRR